MFLPWISHATSRFRHIRHVTWDVNHRPPDWKSPEFAEIVFLFFNINPINTYRYNNGENTR